MRGNDFNDLFNEWAPKYDQTVFDQKGEYNEVFEHYDDILNEVINQIPARSQTILEFGVGTGNLSSKLIQCGYKVIGVEPSEEMRKIVQQKQLNIDLRVGSFLDIPLHDGEYVDSIVSTYAFHHLTYEEKKDAVRTMKEFLRPQGRIVFADTSYKNEEAKKSIWKRVQDQGKQNLLHDLKTEYYEFVNDLIKLYEQEGFSVNMTPLNRFVWLSIATLD